MVEIDIFFVECVFTVCFYIVPELLTHGQPKDEYINCISWQNPSDIEGFSLDSCPKTVVVLARTIVI